MLNNTHVGGEDGPTKTSVPIDVTHKSPFATQNQITGSYSAPEGAPGFVPTSTVGLHDEEEDEYANTNLVGRGEMTEPVLQVSHAKEVSNGLDRETGPYPSPHLTSTAQGASTRTTTHLGLMEPVV